MVTTRENPSAITQKNTIKKSKDADIREHQNTHTHKDSRVKKNRISRKPPKSGKLAFFILGTFLSR